MTPQFKPGAYKYAQSERDLFSACRRLSGRMLALRDRDRKRRFKKGAPALAATIVIAFLLTASAIAQEQQRAYSEYTYWFGGAFENGHAFSSTVDARNYQLASRYERLIYSSPPFAVRWVFDVVPVGTRRGSAYQHWSPCACIRCRRQSYRCTNVATPYGPEKFKHDWSR